MSASEARTRRPRGRPQVRTDEETRHVIAEAARNAFMAKGYSGTAMDDVAEAAGVSKKTLYRLVVTKADLFKSSIEDRIAIFLLAVDEGRLSTLPVVAGLERIMTEYGTLTLSDQTVALQRLVIAEAERFPELASSFYTEAIMMTQQVLVRYLEAQCGLGTLKIADAGMAAGMLRGMMIMEPQRGAMLGQTRVPTPDEIADRARTCVRLFLDGCSADASRA